MLKYKFIKIS